MRIWLATVVGALLAMVALVYVVASSLGTATGATVATTQAVSMVNFAFQPDPITIAVGTTVQWTNTTTNTPHTATSDDGTTFTSPTVNPGQTYMFTFTRTGTFGYYCQFHGSSNGTGMAGTIIVVAPTSTPTRTPTQVVPLVTLTPEAYLPEVPNVPAAATPSPVMIP